MPRAATMLEAMTCLMTDTLSLRRLQAGAWVDVAAQAGLVDFAPSGRTVSIGAGLTGQSDSVPIYLLPDGDAEVGDELVHEGHRYSIAYVSPPGSVAGVEPSMKIAWATTTRPLGGPSQG